MMVKSIDIEFDPDVHVGMKSAFGSYQLIWIDVDHNTHMHTISKKLAKDLMDCGMNFEG